MRHILKQNAESYWEADRALQSTCLRLSCIVLALGIVAEPLSQSQSDVTSAMFLVRLP